MVNIDPSKKILANKDEEQVTEIKPQKRKLFPDKSHNLQKKDSSKIDEDDPFGLKAKPQEKIKATDGICIQNYEVDYQEEEEIVMAGGIRGIRALRVQRD